MRVEYTAPNSTTVTTRFRVEYTGAELAALADLAAIFTRHTGEHDPLYDAMKRAEREWALDNEIQPSLMADREAA